LIVVLDASAAIRIVVASEQSSQYAAILADADEVLAPDLIIAEVTNALWKYFRAGLLTRADVGEKLRACVELVDNFNELGSLALEALDLSLLLQRPAYDMFYLVLARRNCAVLMTADEGLRTCARNAGVLTAPEARAQKDTPPQNR
jgi:predicted nucleic acid-binding protein